MICCNVTLHQVVGPFAVEAAFPLFAITPPELCCGKRNKKAMDILRHGFTSEKRDPISFMAGSQAEGLAMESNVGHGRADVDSMEIFTFGWDVVIRQEKCNLFKDMHHLELDETQSTPAYGRVKVVPGRCFTNGMDQLLRRMDEAVTERIGKGSVSRCILWKDGQMWLSSQETVWALQPSYWKDTVQISGPAGRVLRGTHEYIPCLRCLGPHPAEWAFFERSRPVGNSWPTRKILRRFKFPRDLLLLVCTGPKTSPHRQLEFRLSWSVYEVLMAKDIPLWVRQGYVAFKYTVKKEISELRGCSAIEEGRSVISSYHLKNVLFWTLEEPGAWEVSCAFVLFLLLVEKLSGYLKSPESGSPACRLPLYFLPDCNLLENVPISELEFARQAVRRIQKDPVHAILMSPVDHEEAYGDEDHTSRRKDMHRADGKRYGIEYGGIDTEELVSSTRLLQTAVDKSVSSKEFKRLNHRLKLLDEYRNEAFNRISKVDVKYFESEFPRGDFINLQTFLRNKIRQCRK